MFKNLQKFIFLFLLAVFLFWGFNFWYNQKREVLALEPPLPEEMPLCEEWVGDENIKEVPIGKTTDKIEAMAESIIKEMDIIIGAIPQENKAAVEATDLTDDCKADNCEPKCEGSEWLFGASCYSSCPGNLQPCNASNCGGCPPATPQCCCDWREDCEQKDCEGEPCPDAIRHRFNTVKQQAQIIEDSYIAINTIIDTVLPEVDEGLEKSRDRAVDCFLRALEEKEPLRKELTGLKRCRDVRGDGIPVHAFLEASPDFQEAFCITVDTRFLCEGCYGREYCEAEQREDIAPCAEDYFCCYY